MKVTPVTSPGQSSQQAPPQMSARDRAIATLTADIPVANPNSVSLEEMAGLTQRPKNDETTVIEESPATEVTEVEVKPEPALSNEYAVLARKEKQLRARVQQQEQEFKAKEAALAQREAELAARDQQYKTDYIPKSALKQNALQTLAEAGMTYEDLTQQVINQQPLDPRLEAQIRSMEAKIKAMEEAAETSQKASAEQQTQAYQAAVKQIEMDVKSLVKSESATYEMISATNSIKDVVELIEQTYKDDGVLMSIEEAAQKVEDHLLEETYKLTKIQKIQKRMQPVSTTDTANAPKQIQGSTTKPVQQTQPAKTLTNAMASSRQLTARERAIAAFKGELK